MVEELQVGVLWVVGSWSYFLYEVSFEIFHLPYSFCFDVLYELLVVHNSHDLILLEELYALEEIVLIRFCPPN